MASGNKEEYLKKIVELREKYLAAKACFPYFDDTAIGKAGPFVAPFYAGLGFPVIISFDSPLTREKRDKLNSSGHFINQSVIVFLWGIIDDANKNLSDGRIDKTKSGNERIDILRRLRNQIIHDFGAYDPSDTEESALMNLLKFEFNLKYDLPEFPVMVDEVVKPLFDSCEKYLNAF